MQASEHGHNLNICTKMSFFFYIYNLHFFKQNIDSHQVLTYLKAPEIPVRKPSQNRQIVEEQLDVWDLGVIGASLLTGRHLLMNKKDKNKYASYGHHTVYLLKWFFHGCAISYGNRRKSIIIV